jgi:hypothetical protein
VQYRDDRADHDANDERPGDGQAQQPDIRISIRPKMAVPPTVLVTELDNGTLILQGRPDGPRVWLEPDDAAPLKRELVAAFDRFELVATGNDQSEVR